MIPTVAQWGYVDLIKKAIASQFELAWILPSYACALVSIESGWDPVSVNGSSLGLMQVEAETVPDVVAAYGLTNLGPQSDPYSSLLTGICYFDLAARRIDTARDTSSLLLTDIAQAYQIGYEGFITGTRNARYGAKMLAQQRIWAPLVDTAPPPVAPPPPVLPSPATSDSVIDISHYEKGTIDFTTVAAGGIAAVILKATQGTGFVDPTFLERAADARASGLEVGAYHFMDASDPTAQAANFLTVAVSEGGVNWLALDWEPYPPSQATVMQVSTVAGSIQAATGRWPVLYTIRSMLRAPSTTLSNCPLWLGEWGSNPVPPPGFTAWRLWQHTDGAVGSDVVPVPGIGACDRSRFPGSPDQLRAWWANPI